MLLLREWAVLAEAYSGWSLSEIKGLSRRERKNWLELAREFGKVVKKSG